jgi:drug/metabolite transporter (DMT)-like permease
MIHPQLNRQGVKGVMAALCAAATWGMAGIFVRWLSGWSAFAILAGRFLVATVVMLPIVLLSASSRRELLRSLRSPVIWGLSLPVIGGNFLGITAYQMAPVGEVTLFFTTSPLFIIAYKFLVRSPIKPLEGLGVLLAMAGAILILLPRLSLDLFNPAEHVHQAEQAISWSNITGYVLALGAAGLVALFTVWFNRLNQRGTAPKSIHVVFVSVWLGMILSGFCTLIFGQPSAEISIEINIEPQAVLILTGLGILSTAFPFLCYSMAAQRLPVLLTTALLLLEPIFAVLFASIAFQEFPSLGFGFGSLLVLGGLLLITKAANGPYGS